MKEATGEANMTVITVVLIGIVAAVGIPLIRGLLNNTQNAATCEQQGKVWENGQCVTK